VIVVENFVQEEDRPFDGRKRFRHDHGRCGKRIANAADSPGDWARFSTSGSGSHMP
jgi:hypothetical protein